MNVINMLFYLTSRKVNHRQFYNDHRVMAFDNILTPKTRNVVYHSVEETLGNEGLSSKQEAQMMNLGGNIKGGYHLYMTRISSIIGSSHWTCV